MSYNFKFIHHIDVLNGLTALGICFDFRLQRPAAGAVAQVQT